jgi:hypothetical protein
MRRLIVPNGGFTSMIRYLAVVLFLVSCSLLIPNATRAGDALGTVTNVQTVKCPTGGVKNATCQQLTISCPGVSSQSMMIKTNMPTGQNLGTVVFLSGGGGQGFYDSNWNYGADIINTVLGINSGAGLTTVQTDWGIQDQNNEFGWLEGPGGTRLLACRVATAAQWIQDNIQSGGAFCATGSSGGAGALAYLLDDYGLSMDFTEFTSGPVYSRIDYGCDKLEPNAYSPATGRLTSWDYTTTDAVEYVDPTYGPGNAYCSYELGQLGGSDKYDSILFADSIMWPSANYNFSSATHFAYGALDTGNAPVEAYAFQQAVHSTDVVVPNVGHEMGDWVAGADQISSDITTMCKKP